MTRPVPKGSGPVARATLRWPARARGPFHKRKPKVMATTTTKRQRRQPAQPLGGCDLAGVPC